MGECVTFDADTIIFFQGVQVDELKEFRYPFCMDQLTQSEFGVQVVPILCYRGSSSDPQWVDKDEGKFHAIAAIVF